MKLQLATMFYEKLISKGECISESPKVRELIYQLLNKEGLSYKTEIIGDTGPGKNICRYSTRSKWNNKVITHWFNHGRFYKKDLLDAYNENLCRHFTEQDIEELYLTSDPARVRELIDKMRYIDSKYCIFDFVRLRKMVIKITLKT